MFDFAEMGSLADSVGTVAADTMDAEVGSAMAGNMAMYNAPDALLGYGTPGSSGDFGSVFPSSVNNAWTPNQATIEDQNYFNAYGDVFQKTAPQLNKDKPIQGDSLSSLLDNGAKGLDKIFGALRGGSSSNIPGTASMSPVGSYPYYPAQKALTGIPINKPVVTQPGLFSGLSGSGSIFSSPIFLIGLVLVAVFFFMRKK
jgi:hypothetical protein